MIVTLITVYLAALIFGSITLHRRFGCIAAAVLAGFASSFLATSVFTAFEEKSLNPQEYIAAFWWGGISLWIISTIISGCIGIPIQRKKKIHQLERISSHRV